MNTKIKSKLETKGWNTYNTFSVISHVLLPEGFAINLGFKNYSSGQILKEALIGRFGEKDEKIHPGIRSYDGTYTNLLINYYDTETRVESTVINGEQYLLITPIKQEIRPMTLFIEGAILWNREGYVQRREDKLYAVCPNRVVTVWTDGETVVERNSRLNSPYLSVVLNRPIIIGTGESVTQQEIRGYLNNAKEKVMEQANRYGILSEAYHAMKTCMAWNTIYEAEKGQLCTPVSRLWNVNWGGYILFGWDTYFASMMAMIDDEQLAYANLIAITKEKTEEGFIPNLGAANDVKSRDRSQPPVGSLALKQVYRKYRDDNLVKELFDDLLAWNRWFADNRMLRNGQMCWGSNPPYTPRCGHYCEVNEVYSTKGAALESGLDNSPMYDGILFDDTLHMMKLSDVGLTGLYIMDCETLIELAEVIGRYDVIEELRKRAKKGKEGLSLMWDEEFGMFCNVHTDTGTFSHRISPTNFYSLFSDQVTEYQIQRMMKEHFYNPKEFWGDYMIPMIARNDPGYSDQDYWRGRIWAPTNFLTYLAMRKHGLKQECKVMADKSRELILKEWLEHGHVHENYNCDTGMGCGVNASDKFYHWGGLLTLISLMEEGFVPGVEDKL